MARARTGYGGRIVSRNDEMPPLPVNRSLLGLVLLGTTCEVMRAYAGQHDHELWIRATHETGDLVVELMNEANIDSCYPVAYSNRGDDLLGKGNADGAIAAYRQAIERAPDEETSLSSLIFALQVAGETQVECDVLRGDIIGSE